MNASAGSAGPACDVAKVAGAPAAPPRMHITGTPLWRPTPELRGARRDGACGSGLGRSPTVLGLNKRGGDGDGGGEGGDGDGVDVVSGRRRGLQGLAMGLRPNLSVDDLCRAAVAAQVTQKDVVVVFAEMLTKLAEKCPSGRERPAEVMRAFMGQRMPKVSLKWYLWRLVYYLNKYPRVEPTFFAGDEGTISADFSSGKDISSRQDRAALSRGLRALLLSLVYIDRVTSAHADFVVNPMSLHRVVLTAILAATKFTDDFPLGVDLFARIGGIATKEMNQMELSFCSLIGFNFHVSEAEFETKCMGNLSLAFDIASQRVGKRQRTLPSPRNRASDSPVPGGIPSAAKHRPSPLSKQLQLQQLPATALSPWTSSSTLSEQKLDGTPTTAAAAATKSTPCT